MSVLQHRNVLLGVTGGIAAYKAAFLVRLFIKEGAHVKVIMTPDAEEFVTPLTLSTLSKNPVYSTFTDQEKNWNNHVEIAEWADVMVIAPATANTISKMVLGKSDNLLITTYMSATCPVYVAPAMDLDMYKHHSTQKNLKTLSTQQHYIIEPESGELASGLVGKGRMAEPEHILRFIKNNVENALPLRGKKILITAGPTYEPIDPVRFIGNYSSGKMGFSLTKVALSLGAQVVLITGPTALDLTHDNLELIRVTTARQMYDKALAHYDDMDVAIASAAVSDYRVKEVFDKKIKKTEDTLTLELVKNPDILKAFGERKKTQILIGFALETNNEVENAKTKLETKNLDFIVLNSLQDKGAGFKKDTNKVTIITNRSTTRFDTKPKKDAAKDIFDFLIKHEMK